VGWGVLRGNFEISEGLVFDHWDCGGLIFPCAYLFEEIEFFEQVLILIC